MGAFSAMAQDFFDEVKDHAKKQGLDHMGVSLIERHSVSFTTRFWNTFWSQRINASIGAVGANRMLQILAADRHLSHRLVTGSKDAAPVPLIHGRFGYGVPKAKQNSIALDEVEDNIADYLPAAAYSSVLEEGAASHTGGGILREILSSQIRTKSGGACSMGTRKGVSGSGSPRDRNGVENGGRKDATFLRPPW